MNIESLLADPVWGGLLPWTLSAALLVLTGVLALLGRGWRRALQQAQEAASAQAGQIQKLHGENATLAAQVEAEATRRMDAQQELGQAREQIERLREALHGEQRAAAELRARVEEERKAADEKTRLLEATREKLTEQFKLLSAEALEANKKSLLQLADERLKQQEQIAQHDLEKRRKAVDELVQPLRESLSRLETQNQKLEAARTEAYGAINQQMQALIETHLPALRGETDRLVRALRQPHTRGRWGEVQLKRVAEMAGMTERVDFSEQESVTSEGSRLRPDMVVHLPGGRRIVVDAKAPISAYLEAIEAADEEARGRLLKQHAQQLRTHIQQLGGKQYFDQFERTPEFVVLFVPGEVFFSEALKADPSLIEYGAERKVIVASPTTLIALLKAVSYGWRQEDLAKNAEEVARLGRELYERIGSLAGHWQKMGKALDQAVGAYNKAVGTLESRVLVSARRFGELKVVGEETPPLESLDHATRPLAAPEMQNEAATEAPRLSVSAREARDEG